MATDAWAHHESAIEVHSIAATETFPARWVAHCGHRRLMTKHVKDETPQENAWRVALHLSRQLNWSECALLAAKVDSGFVFMRICVGDLDSLAHSVAEIMIERGAEPLDAFNRVRLQLPKGR